MDYKKIGKFIKDLLKSKGMNQEDLAKVLNITPQAVSKSLNGVNTFDLANLKTISELFEVTIDDILNGELQTSTAPMTEQERLVKLGINAIKSANRDLINKKDEKEKNILDYAVIQKNHEIIEYVLENRLLRRSYAQFLRDDKFLKLVIDNNLEKHLISIMSIDTRYNADFLSQTSKELWSCQNEELIDILYLRNAKDDWNSKIISIPKFDLAVRFNNKKVIDKWFHSLGAKNNRISGHFQYLEIALMYFNHYFIEKFLNHAKENNRALVKVYCSMDVYHMYYGDVKLLDFVLEEYSKTNIEIKYDKISTLLEEFFDKKDYTNLLKYSQYGSIPSSKFEDYDIENMSIDELIYLFKAGAMPTAQYNNEKSVNKYVENTNRILLKLATEILKNKK